MKSLALLSLLLVAGMTVARADDGKCAAGHLSMLQTGVVSLGEVVIDYPIEKVWAVLPYYYEWSVHHHNSERTAIRGERGKVGETVRVHQAGAPSAFYVETIRIRPPKTIDGEHRAGNMAWKISDQDVCFVRFNDFSVREYNGKTIFARSVYEALAPGAPKRLIVGRDQLDGKPDALHSQMSEVKANVEAYIRRTAHRPAAEAAPAQASPLPAQAPSAVPTGAAAAAGSCAFRHKAMLQTGTVNYGEVVIDRPIDEVWSTLPVFYRWNPVHSNGTRKTIRGEAGKAGEVVEIVKAGTTEAIYTETVRIQPPRTIDGAHRSGHIVWKVYDREGCFSRYSDFGVREYQGKTIFYRAMYGEHDPSGATYRKIRSEQQQGVPDQLDTDVIDMRTRMLEYLKQRESKARVKHRTLQERLGAGQPLLGLLQMYPNRSLEELAAGSGYDFLMVDGEHGYFTEAEFRGTLDALANSDTLALLRVPKLDPRLAERYLDMGADVIVAPLVSTVEDAKTMARATTSRKGGLIVLLETRGGVENAAAILAVPGVDGVIIGPGDLSNDLGVKGQYSHPTFTQAFSQIERAAAAARKPYGTIVHGNNTLEALSARGHTILLQTSDHALIGAALKSQAAAARSALQGKAPQ